MKFRYSLTLTREERAAILELLNWELDAERPSRTGPQWRIFEKLAAQLREKLLATK